MKITTFLFCILFTHFALSGNAQVPDAINYQTVVRDGNGEILANQNISLRFTIRQGSQSGTSVYQETHALSTNEFGLAKTYIATGNVVSGSFSGIDWLANNYYLQVELDAGTGYSNMGTAQLVSVPYSLAAGKAATATNMTLDDMTNVNTGTPAAGQVLEWNGAEWVAGTDDTGAGGDDWGNQSAVTNSTLTGNGTAGNALGIAQQGATSGQVLKWNGTAWAPANDVGGGAGDNWGTQVVQTDATLSGQGIVGNTLKLAQQGAASGQVLKWNGTTWAPGADDGGNVLSGSPNYLVKFISNDAGGLSQIFDDGSFVGIGTIAPDYRLHIVNTGEDILKLQNQVALSVDVASSQYFQTGSWYTGAIKTIGTGTNSARLGLYTYAATASSGLIERVSILDNGNVGIGVTNPTAKLEVNGNIKISGGNPGAGKVLTSDAAGVASWEDIANPHIAFSEYTFTSQTVGSLATLQLVPTTESFDDGNAFSGGQFTAPSDGVYHFDMQLDIYGVSNYSMVNSHNFYVLKNGGALYSFSPSKNVQMEALAYSFTEKLVAGDVITFQIYNGASTSLYAALNVSGFKVY